MSFLQENRVKFFYEAVQHGSVRAAADFLNVAPSAVSRQISRLEQELDTILIERHRRGIKPTQAGEEVLRYYKRYLLQQELLLDNLKSLQGLQSGTIELAIGEGYINIISKAIRRFSTQYPGVKIQLFVHSGNDVLRKIVDDDAHIGIVFNPPPHPKIRSHYTVVHPMAVVVDKMHPLNDEPQPLEMSLLKRYPIALPDMSHCVRQLIDGVENETNTTLNYNVISNNLTALHYYAAHGGVTLIPAFVIQGGQNWDKSLNCLSLKHARLNHTHTHVISRLGRQLGKAPSLFLKMLISLLENEHRE
jgi:DNA-binding transcriptional LysR family regulator